MKKLLTIIIAALISAPVFAFNFNSENFEIDTNIRAEINRAIEQNINDVIQETYNQHNNVSQQYCPDDDITLAIKDHLNFVMKRIDSNCGLRTRWSPTRRFVKEQEIQKQRYANIVKWNIPYKISDYIKSKYNLQEIGFIRVVCEYTNGKTSIQVHFKHNLENVIITYTYTETPWQPSIIQEVYK